MRNTLMKKEETLRQIAAVVALREAGYTFRQIEETLGISSSRKGWHAMHMYRAAQGLVLDGSKYVRATKIS